MSVLLTVLRTLVLPFPASQTNVLLSKDINEMPKEKERESFKVVHSARLKICGLTTGQMFGLNLAFYFFFFFLFL